MKKVCRMCKGNKFDKVLDMGLNPLVNSLIEKEDLDKTEAVYPLEVVRCRDCSLVQTKKPIDSHEIYTAQDYLYYTGDMPTTDEYFTDFAKELSVNLNPSDFVVEIGSNDGTMLKNFPCIKLGVDPSTNVVIRALKNGVPTLSAPFNENNAKNIAREYGKAKVVGGANCIAHIDDLDSLMRGVQVLLADDGVFWVECNYWGGMVKNKNYALIYHDHYSYFSLKNWMDILGKIDMRVFDAYITAAQGQEGLSLRLFACRNTSDREMTERFYQLEVEEDRSKLNSYETAERYRQDVLVEARKLKQLVAKIKEEGKTIAGYGAAAKGFSLLQLAGITNEISYFVDDSPAKQGKFTPVNHIPVVARKNAEDPDFFFITAPNYAKIIMEREQEFRNRGGKFILADGSIA